MQKDIGFDTALEFYCRQNFVKEHPVLSKLRQVTGQMPEARMQTTPLQGQFLGFLVKLTQAKLVLEIGTYTGYSSLAMALNLPAEGRLVACDKNAEWTKVAQHHWKLAQVEHKIELRLGAALETLTLLDQENSCFDLIFIDADKKNYKNYYEASLPILKPSGVIVVDNVLWRGKVAVEPLTSDLSAQSIDPVLEDIKTFNQNIAQDNRVEICLVPIGDGMTLIRKKG